MPGACAEKFKFDLDGGTIAMDFVNSISGLRGVNPREHLLVFDDLAYWAHQAGLIDRHKMYNLRALASLHPRRAAEALERSLRAREALHDVALAAAQEREPPAAALAELNSWISAALAKRRIVPKGPGRFEVRFEDDDDLLAFLRPVALDAARLLETGEPIRVCAELEQGRCGWLFLDETKNRSRRFCSMRECGNRAKQRRFRQKHAG